MGSEEYNKYDDKNKTGQAEKSEKEFIEVDKDDA